MGNIRVKITKAENGATEFAISDCKDDSGLPFVTYELKEGEHEVRQLDRFNKLDCVNIGLGKLQSMLNEAFNAGERRRAEDTRKQLRDIFGPLK